MTSILLQILQIRRRRLGAGLLLAAFMLAPPSVYSRDLAGLRVTVQGQLTVRIIENLNRQPPAMTLEFFLRDDSSGVTRRLQFSGPPPADLRTGQGVTVQGYVEGDFLRVETLTPADRPAAPAVGATSSNAYTTGSAAEAANLPPAPMVGARNAVVLIVDLLDAKVSAEFPDVKRHVTEVMYAGDRSVDRLYRDSSHNQLYFTPDTNGDGQPDVFGPFTISYYAAQDCSYGGWAIAAEAAATAAGVDLSLYQHRLFVLPRYDKLPQCRWSGISDVGCPSSCRTWIAEAESPQVYAHELGHSLNLAHAGVDPENDGAINNAYDDYSSPMSMTRKWRRFHAPHIDQLGWYASYPGGVVNVTADGTYSIAPIGTSPAAGAPLMLKLRKPDANQFYYLSYRQASGLDCVDETTCIDPVYTRGVNVHRYRGYDYETTAFIRSLRDQETFTDSANAITVTQLSHSDQLVTVSVTLCDAREPLLSLTSIRPTAPPGGTASYEVTVANQDANADCRTDFTLSYSGPGRGTFSPAWLDLGGGQSGVATLQLDATGLADGVYTDVLAQAADNDGAPPVHPTPGSGGATLIVDGAPPTAPGNVRAFIDAQNRVVLNWTAATDTGSGVATYAVRRNGVALGQTAALSYADGAAVTGQRYTYTVTATDQAGNVSPDSTAVTIGVGCAAANPTVTLTPVSQAAKLGVSAMYAVSVVNKDSGACPTTVFTLSRAVAPNGPVVTLAPTSLTLAAGQTGAATLTAKSSKAGSFTLSVQAAGNGNKLPAHAGATGGAFIADGAAPTTPTKLQALVSPGQVALTWTASTDALSGVQSYLVYRGNAVIAETPTPSYADAAVVKGTKYAYAVAAKDKAGNVSAKSASKQVIAQ